MKTHWLISEMWHLTTIGVFDALGLEHVVVTCESM